MSAIRRGYVNCTAVAAAAAATGPRRSECSKRTSLAVTVQRIIVPNCRLIGCTVVL